MSEGDDWVRRHTAEAEQMQQQAAQLQNVIATARGNARSADGSVTAVVAPGGALISLHLDERSVQLGARRLEATITETIHRASADAAAQLEAVVRPVIGDRFDEAFKAVQVQEPPVAPPPPPPQPGQPQYLQSQQAPPPPAPPRPARPPRPADEDDDFGGSHLQRGW